jgi:hypothetical protein
MHHFAMPAMESEEVNSAMIYLPIHYVSNTKAIPQQAASK